MKLLKLPITLILRPFNFETFTTAYVYASEDLLEAAAPSLFLILIAVSLFYLNKIYLKNKK